MEQDESVPLTFERRGAEVPEVIPGMQVRGTAPDAAPEVIDITGMLSDLEAGRKARGG